MGRLLLVRHGQASWGADDYDVLSPLGHRQGEALGEIWRLRGVVPDRVISGGMRRHRETAEAAGLSVSEVDTDWAEFDHVAMLARVPMPDDANTDRSAFQQWFETASNRWTDGVEDDYDESFAAFTSRVGAALSRLADTLPRSGTAVVLTSGGPVAWAAASLLADTDAARTDLWLRLNPVSINTGTSTVVCGSRGTTLVTFNAADHLSPDLITYR